MYNKPNNDAVVRALNRSAYPLLSTEPYGSLRELQPLDWIIGNAPIVGIGEAAHGAHEFFTLKHRVFKYLVEEKGFTTFMLEIAWGTGLQLNDYVLYGKGDPRQIMRQEFVQNGRLFANEEYVRLIEWMRAYNKKYPERRQLQFMGNDVDLPHIRIFADIFSYVRERGHSELVPKLMDLYDGLIPTTDLNTWALNYNAKPESERQQVQLQAEEALRLVKSLRWGADREAADWAEQQATVVVWIARTNATDEFWFARDQAMAENALWWYRHKNSKILISAHNVHIGHNPEDYKTEGTWLKQFLGPCYVSFGLAFYQGSFLAVDNNTGLLTKFTVGPPPPDNAERALGQVRFLDYMLDMRTVGNPARAWLNQDQPVRNILAKETQATVENEIEQFPLRRTYDNLIMIHDITASHPISGVR
jgi:erythromycin esterase